MVFNKRKKIESLLIKGTLLFNIVLLVYGIACGITLQYVWPNWDFSKSGPMGDTISGVLNPIIALANLIVLIWLTRSVSVSDDRRMINQFRYERFNELKDKFKEFKDFQINFDIMRSNYQRLGEYLLEFNGYNGYLFSEYPEVEKSIKSLSKICAKITTECQKLNEVGKTNQLPSPEMTYFLPLPDNDDIYREYKEYMTSFKKGRRELIVLLQNIIIGNV